MVALYMYITVAAELMYQMLLLVSCKYQNVFGMGVFNSCKRYSNRDDLEMDLVVLSVCVCAYRW